LTDKKPGKYPNHIVLGNQLLFEFCSHFLQDTTNVLVRHCGPKFFSLPLPGSTMMILDFIHAANTIASSPDLKEVCFSKY